MMEAEGSMTHVGWQLLSASMVTVSEVSLLHCDWLFDWHMFWWLWCIYVNVVEMKLTPTDFLMPDGP